MKLFDFFSNKRIFVTGHTGFKGSWLISILNGLGAKVCGYALPANKGDLFEIIKGETLCESHYGDIADYDNLFKVFSQFQPEIVIHLAAQPIVLTSYEKPRETYETNVMGTCNILECVRQTDCVKTFLNVTTDKVYKNKEVDFGYSEDDELDGFDPYSNSKSCSELVTHCYKKSFFDGKIAVSTARAGNVIGGGDFSANRIIPDCVRFAINKQDILVRNPNSIRPYQHVLEPLFVYLDIVKAQYEDMSFAGYYNVGPDESDCVNTATLVEMFCSAWGENQKWISQAHKNAPHEANFLKLNNSKIKKVFGWKPKLDIENAVKLTVEWSKGYRDGKDVLDIIRQQINAYLLKA